MVDDQDGECARFNGRMLQLRAVNEDVAGKLFHRSLRQRIQAGTLRQHFDFRADTRSNRFGMLFMAALAAIGVSATAGAIWNVAGRGGDSYFPETMPTAEVIASLAILSVLLVIMFGFFVVLPIAMIRSLRCDVESITIDGGTIRIQPRAAPVQSHSLSALRLRSRRLMGGTILSFDDGGSFRTSPPNLHLRCCLKAIHEANCHCVPPEDPRALLSDIWWSATRVHLPILLLIISPLCAWALTVLDAPPHMLDTGVLFLSHLLTMSSAVVLMHGWILGLLAAAVMSSGMQRRWQRKRRARQTN